MHDTADGEKKGSILLLNFSNWLWKFIKLIASHDRKVVWGPNVLSVSVQNPQDGWWVAAQERRLCALVAWWWARAGFGMLVGAGQKPLLSRLRRLLAVLAGPRRYCKWQGAKRLPGKSEEGGVCSQCLWQNELKQGMGSPALPVDCSAMPQFWE